MISVVIPLYNKADYIGKCLNSVLDQTFREFELIIIDDGSTDDSVEIVNNILSGKKINTDQRLLNPPLGGLKIISQENSGVSTARNNGVKITKYDYIAFLDADDWWDSGFLEEMQILISSYPDAALYGCNYFYVKNGKNKIEDKGLPANFKKGYIDYIKVYGSKLTVPINCSFVVVQKAAFYDVGKFNPILKFGEDFDLWIRLALKYRVAYNNAPLAYSNQDIEIKQRAVGNLHNPKSHVLWNIGYLSEKEQINQDLKKLLDNLRVYSLFPYFINNQYRSYTKQELQKVNWEQQPVSIIRKYKLPIIYLKFLWIIKRLGSEMKHYFKKIL